MKVQIDGSEADIMVEDVFIEVGEGGILGVSDVTFGADYASVAPTVLINSGTMSFESCTFLNGVQLESLMGSLQLSASKLVGMDVAIRKGSAELSYSTIESLKSFVNDAGSLIFENMEVTSTGFSFYSGDGEFILTDADVVYGPPGMSSSLRRNFRERFYIPSLTESNNMTDLIPSHTDLTISTHFLSVERFGLDDDVLRTYCGDTSTADKGIFQVIKDVNQCQALCDTTSKCSGIWFDSEGQTFNGDSSSAVCGLCVPGSCRFDCQLEGSYILHKQPAVLFTGIQHGFCPVADPVYIEGLPALSNLDDCRGWCSTLSFCQAFTFDAAANSCVFHDSAIIAPCISNGNETHFIDTRHDAGLGKFVQIPEGLCFPESTLQLSHVGTGIQNWLATPEDCAAFCGALPECSAFDIDPVISKCRFFSWDAVLEYSSKCDSTAYLSVQDSSFPLGLSSSVKHFRCSADPELSQLAMTAGGLKVCETECKSSHTRIEPVRA